MRWARFIPVIEFFQFLFFFFFEKLGKVEGHTEPNGTSDKSYTQSSLDNSRSDGTMQNALASVGQFGRFLESFSRFEYLEYLNL